jgi:hypothetical protein
MLHVSAPTAVGSDDDHPYYRYSSTLEKWGFVKREWVDGTSREAWARTAYEMR